VIDHLVIASRLGRDPGMETKLIQVGDRVINLDSVMNVRKFDNGSVRIVTMIHDPTEKRFNYYDYEGEEAEKIFSFFCSKATKIF
jgi:hypothetical protein